jgi:hypothetical protein
MTVFLTCLSVAREIAIVVSNRGDVVHGSPERFLSPLKQYITDPGYLLGICRFNEFSGWLWSVCVISVR